MLFKTENGTWYRLDRTLMTWARVVSTQTSGKTRREEGKLTKWPQIQVGYPAVIQDEDVLPGCTHHAVVTSLVTEIREEESV